jgi:hypothetical protein
MPLLKGYSVPRHHTLIECKPGFRAIPFDEFSDRMIIGSLGTRRGQAVQNGRLRLLKVRELQNRLGCPFAVHFALCHRYGLHSPWQTAWFGTPFRSIACWGVFRYLSWKRVDVSVSVFTLELFRRQYAQNPLTLPQHRAKATLRTCRKRQLQSNSSASILWLELSQWGEP